MSNNVLSINGKVILVTGAFGLIGKEVSSSFLSHGGKVVLAGHNPEQIESIQEELKDMLLNLYEIQDDLKKEGIK